jgi:hypothetical protein
MNTVVNVLRGAKMDRKSDNRKAERHPTINFVWYRVIGIRADEDQNPVEGLAKSCNISETGLGLLVPIPLPVDEKIFVEIAIKNFNLSAVGRIVFSIPIEGNYQQVGIQFLAVPPNDRMLLIKSFENHASA